MGSLIDTKGNKIAGFDSIDKKQARVNVFVCVIHVKTLRQSVKLGVGFRERHAGSC